MSNICIQLDDRRFVQNWYHLGLKIGIDGKQWQKLQDSSEYSPAEEVLNTIYTLAPDLLLTDMKDDLKTLKLVAGLEEPIANALGKFEGKRHRGYFMVGECERFFFTSCERRERTSERSERVSSATPRNE